MRVKIKESTQAANAVGVKSSVYFPAFIRDFLFGVFFSFSKNVMSAVPWHNVFLVWLSLR